VSLESKNKTRAFKHTNLPTWHYIKSYSQWLIVRRW